MGARACVLGDRVSAIQSSASIEVGCPGVDTILAYVDRVLDAASCERIELHVDGCPACAAVIAHAVREQSSGARVAVVASTRGGPESSSSWSQQPLPLRVGRYVVLQCIGRGGMGVVCAAFDPRLQRSVAVKLLRPDRDDPGAAARLRREARALAALAHPNVVAVFECGALEDRDGEYLVMELIHGETLRSWCARTRPRVAAVIEAYVAAARGLGAAHAAGLVHRDFKPDNVLVGRDGRVCVTDFGLARTIAAPTVAGASKPGSSDADASTLAGTPTYMAPEQRDGGVVGPASDQYALCVSLWEAIAGAGPSPGHARRLPKRLRTVLERGLEPDPAQRWPDMAALVAALQRARRLPRALVVTAVLGVAALALGVRAEATAPAPSMVAVDCAAAGHHLDAVWSVDRRATIAAMVARAEAPAVLEGLDAWVDRWRRRAATACADTPALLAADGCLATAVVQLDTMLGVLERAESLDHHLRAAVRDLPAPEACSEHPTATVAVADAAAVREAIAQAAALVQVHRFDGARSVAAQAVALAEASDEGLWAEALAEQALVLHAAGDFVGEGVAAQQAYLHAEAVGLDALAAAVATHRVFTCAQVENRYDDAEAWSRHAESAIARMPAALRPLPTARLALAQAHIAAGAGRIDDALAAVSLAIERLEPRGDVPASELAGAYNDRGTLLVERDPGAALAAFEQALDLVRSHYGEDHPRVAMLMSNVAGVHYYSGEVALAVEGFDAAVHRLEAVLGQGHHDVAGAYINLSLAQDSLGDHVAAASSMARGLEILTRTLGAEHPDVALAQIDLGAFDLRAGDIDTAERRFRDALGTLERTVGPHHLYCTNALEGLARVAELRGWPAQAVPLRERALAIALREQLGPPELTAARVSLADAQLAAGDGAGARRSIELARAALAEAADTLDDATRDELEAVLRAWPDDEVNAPRGGSD